MSCPPCPPPPCPPVCAPPPPPPTCRVKPLMRGLHWSQTTRNLTTMFVAMAVSASIVYILVKAPRRAAYADYYRKAELEDIGDSQARKGLLQSVTPESLKEN